MLHSAKRSPLYGSAQRKRLAQLLILLTTLLAVLVGQGYTQISYDAQFTHDLNDSTSLRYRSLLIYSMTHTQNQLPTGSLKSLEVFRDMQHIHARLQRRYPDEAVGFEADWKRYQQELTTRGAVEFVTAEALLNAANRLTYAIEDTAQKRATRIRLRLGFGVFVIGLAVPFALVLFQQLRDVQRLLSQQNTALEGAAYRFRALFEGVPVPCFSYDREGKITAWNHAAETVFGYTFQEVVGRPFWEITSSPERWAAAKEFTAQVLAGNALSELEWKHFHSDGTTRHFISSVFPMRDADDKVTGGLAANIDLTSRVESNVRLQAATEELTRSNAALQDFAYVASHDLKEPLRKIQTFGGMLRRRMINPTQDQTEYLDRVLSAASRMQSLIEGLMEYSRVTTRDREPEAVPLDALVRDVLLDLETRIDEKDALIEVAKLPSVCVDAVQMRQLFQNLVSNALKFHDESRRTEISIWSEPNATQGRVTVNIRDNGIGFDPKFSDRIFEVFERLESKQSFEGTGIGLAICRKIVERHGGKIIAVGTLGQGALFSLDLPLALGKDCA